MMALMVCAGIIVALAVLMILSGKNGDSRW